MWKHLAQHYRLKRVAYLVRVSNGYSVIIPTTGEYFTEMNWLELQWLKCRMRLKLLERQDALDELY